MSIVVCWRTLGPFTVGFVPSDVGQFLGFISVLVDLGQRPDEARPFISLGHTDLLQKRRRILCAD